jgi:hypothetical protein
MMSLRFLTQLFLFSHLFHFQLKGIIGATQRPLVKFQSVYHLHPRDIPFFDFAVGSMEIVEFLLEPFCFFFRRGSLKSSEFFLEIFCFIFRSRTPDLQLKPILIRVERGMCPHFFQAVSMCLRGVCHLINHGILDDFTILEYLELLV